MNIAIIRTKTNPGKMRFLSRMLSLVFVVTTLLTAVDHATAQSTAFTFQGKLNDNSAAASGMFDLEFRLFDVAAGSSALASQQKTNVEVADGVFSVQLDFGSAAFAGSSRYIEIAVKRAGAASYTTLSPRTPINSAPYAIKSLNAATADNASQLGGQAAGNFIQTNDPRLSDERVPVPGSPSYIQNSTIPQLGSSFNISGNGTVGQTLNAHIVNAASHFNIAGNRVLSVPGNSNTYAGINTGIVSTGTGNSFFGSNAGVLNSTGSYNTFFGSNAGAANSTAINNSFFGQAAGYKNTQGHDNTLIGNGAGLNITTASNNTMVGGLAGQFGNGANNTFVGYTAGGLNSGNGNTYLGYGSGGAVSVNNATAIGANAYASQSNSVVLGSIIGVNGATTSAYVGIGTSNPLTLFHVKGSGGGNMLVGEPCGAGYIALGLQTTLTCSNYSMMTDYLGRTVLSGDGMSFRVNNSEVAWINQTGKFAFETVPSFRQIGNGQYSWTLCINAASEPSYCSSSLRYKKDVQNFKGGLAMVRQLRPITFRWKADDIFDFGFAAEEVAKIEPLLAIHNKKGEIEGVKYDRISVLLVDAVKEQQAIIDRQQTEIDALKQLVCRKNKKATVCRGK